ncbi:hypothetical protein MD484_g1989, partial [Candolleomyces efflorescens]
MAKLSSEHRVSTCRSFNPRPVGLTCIVDGIPQTQRKLNRRPPSQGKATAHTAMGNSNEDSLAGTPFRETKSGLAAHVLARIEKMAATRRAERLDAEAQQAQEAPSQPTQAQTATLLTSNDFATSAPIHDRTSHFRQNKGQSRTTRAFGGRQPGEPRTANFFNNEANNGANSALDRTSQFKQRNREQFRADRASGDRPYKGNSTFRPKAKRPPPRVSTVNFAPKRTAQTVDNSANLTATDLNPNVEAPNYPGPFAVSPDLRNIFRKPVFSQLDVALSKVSSTSPSSLKETNRILRRFAGDYSASVPNQSQALYTTPIEKLPVRTQLELAMSKSKDLDIPSRQYLTHVVSKAIGEVPSGTIV